ncbi:MAG: aspartate-semialdehyde dehydrogenase [Sulfuriferula sp.]
MSAAVVNIAVLGVTTLVGEAVLAHLAAAEINLGQLYLLSSGEAVGSEIRFKYQDKIVTDVDTFDFSQAQMAILAADADLAARIAPIAVAAGCVVIDTSPQFRQDDAVPLVVVGVNEAALKGFGKDPIIASPCAVSMHLALSLKSIASEFGLVSVTVSTYQAVSGSGQAGVDELAEQTKAIFSLNETENNVYAKRISFNILPQVGDLMDNGYSIEEMKLVNETRKVLALPELVVNPTAVRVPVFYGHGQSVQITTIKPVSVGLSTALWQQQAGILVADSDDGVGPTPVDVVGCDDVFVGRIRGAMGAQSGLNYWLVADNIHSGVALNSVRIVNVLKDLM